MNQITRGLLDKGIRVKVMALNPPGNAAAAAEVTDSYLQETGLEVFPIDTRVKAGPAIRNLFTRESYNISRFHCPKMSKRLEQLLHEEEFDIIQLEGLFLTPYLPVIRQHTRAPVIFRSHNIEHFIWERMARTTTNPLKKGYLRLLASRLKTYEMRTVHQVDGLVAISTADMHFFKQHGFARPGVTIPVGADNPLAVIAEPEAEKYSVFHLGSMDWRPNQEGLRWFMEAVWPMVARMDQRLRFYLAGKNIPASFYEYAGDQVVVAGQVPDASRFIRSKELMVVPLHSGGGMRVKIIEGMALGKAIVSTGIGAEGIHCTHKENILLADTASEMAEAILHCFANREFMEMLGRNAREFVMKHHAMKPLIDELIAFYKTFLPDKDYN